MSRFSFFPEKPLERYNKSDTGVLVATILLWGIGMVTLYFCSASNALSKFGDDLYFVKRQLISSVLGLFGAFFFAAIKIKALKKILPGLVLMVLLLSIFTIIPGIGTERNGARRWLNLGFFTLQSSELVKIVLVFFLANFFEKQSQFDKDDRKILPAVIMILIFTLLIVAQKDLSTLIVILSVCFIMFIMTGVKILHIVLIFVFLLVAGTGLIFSERYRLNRILAYLRPSEFSDGVGYQAKISISAIKSGGLWGKGIGSGLSEMMSIPEVHADYIFAGWSEAMGLFGVTVYVILLCFFSYRAFRIALLTKNRFAAFATFGFASLILLQSLLNCAVVANVVPSTGIPLPFFSSGGSSMLVTLCMCGFIVNASRYSEEIESEMENNL